MEIYSLFRIGLIHSHIEHNSSYPPLKCLQSIIIEQSAIDSVSQPKLVKAPAWLRVLQISIGAISIILSGYVLAQPGLAIFTAVQILSIVLLFVGIESIAVGALFSSMRLLCLPYRKII